MSRSSILEKVKALHAKTKANGATEHEELAALAKARALMDAYDIPESELAELRDEEAVGHSEPPDTLDPHRLKWQLSEGIQPFCNVLIYHSRKKNGLSVIGLRSDVDYALYLLDHLSDFIIRQLYAHLITSLAPPSERRIKIRSFTTEACQRLNERMSELVEQSKTARTSNGRELAVIQDAAIKDYLVKHNLRLHACSGGPTSTNYDAEAGAAGRPAGDRASFGRPVTGAAGVLRIGGR
jgi:hypothetical protein